MVVAGTTILLVAGLGAWRIAGSGNLRGSSQTNTRRVLALDSFTVNLADPEAGRFLRTTFSLGIEGELPASGKGSASDEVSSVSIAQIRDSIINVLAQYKADELLAPEGKSQLKLDVLNALNRDVPALRAREVYFTEFLVQR